MEQQAAGINEAACCYYYERMQDAGSQIHAERPCNSKHNKAARQIFEGEMPYLCNREDAADKIELNDCDGDFSD